ncbi:hypothetical protein EVAR_79138_1 [Eumeta japonica]|uniref:Uncharacterized protein n=1 Tax=Eumeta variegata TaxID=151549 RepID=A0A4C1UTF3_EUMVA|nr:hypothetical protein EVAR_79138_1 [Eumeta japonica]
MRRMWEKGALIQLPHTFLGCGLSYHECGNELQGEGERGRDGERGRERELYFSKCRCVASDPIGQMLHNWRQ